MGHLSWLRELLRKDPAVAAAFRSTSEQRATRRGLRHTVIDAMTHLHHFVRPAAATEAGVRSRVSGTDFAAARCELLLPIQLGTRWCADLDARLQHTDLIAMVFDQPALVPTEKEREQQSRSSSASAPRGYTEPGTRLTDEGLYIGDNPEPVPFELSRVLATRALRRDLFNLLLRSLARYHWSSVEGRIVLDYSTRRLYVYEVAHAVLGDGAGRWVATERPHGEADLEALRWLHDAPSNCDVEVDSIDTDFMVLLSVWYDRCVTEPTRPARLVWRYNDAKSPTKETFVDIGAFVAALRTLWKPHTVACVLVTLAALNGSDYCQKADVTPWLSAATLAEVVPQASARELREMAEDPRVFSALLVRLWSVQRKEAVGRLDAPLHTGGAKVPAGFESYALWRAAKYGAEGSQKPGAHVPAPVDRLAEVGFPCFRFNVRYWLGLDFASLTLPSLD